MEVSADFVPDQDPAQQQRQPDKSDPSMNSLARAWLWVHLWETNGVELVPGVLSKLAVHLARTSVTVDTQRSIVGRSRENIIALLERDNGIDGSSGASNTLVSPPTILALIRALTHTRELRLSMTAHTFIHALLDRYTPIERDPRWTERQLAQLTFELGRRGDVAACWRIWRRVEAIAATRDDGVAAAEIRASTLRQFTHAFAAHSDIRTLTSFIRHIPTASPARGEALISIVDRVRHRDAHRQLHDAFTDLTPLTPYAEMADLSSPSRIYGRSTPTSLLYNVLHAGAEHYRALKGMQADEAARDFSMRLSEAVLRLRRRVTGSRGVEHGTELRRILEAVE